MFSRERIEMELLRIKESVPADYVGPNCLVSYDFSKNRGFCIIGELAIRLGITVDDLNRAGTTITISAISGKDEQLACSLAMAVSDNDNGMPWHTIIDKFIPAEIRHAKDAATEGREETIGAVEG